MNDEHLEIIRSKLKKLFPRIHDIYKVDTLGIFGSYSRQEENPASDIDLLVTFSDPPGLLKFIELENLLSDELGIHVDLVMKDALHPTIGKHILDEVIAV